MISLTCSGRYCRTTKVSVGPLSVCEAWSSLRAPIGLPSEPGPLLHGTAFDFALDRWHGKGGRFSLSSWIAHWVGQTSPWPGIDLSKTPLQLVVARMSNLYYYSERAQTVVTV